MSSKPFGPVSKPTRLTAVSSSSSRAAFNQNSLPWKASPSRRATAALVTFSAPGCRAGREVRASLTLPETRRRRHVLHNLNCPRIRDRLVWVRVHHQSWKQALGEVGEREADPTRSLQS